MDTMDTMDVCSSNSGRSPGTDRSHLKYFINRQYGYNVSRSFHSSLYAIERLHFSHYLLREDTIITALTFNSNGNILVNGSNDNGTVTIWNWDKSKCFGTLRFLDRGDNCVVVFHQLKCLPPYLESFLISTDSNGDVSMLDTKTGAVRKLFGHVSNRHSIAVLKDFPCIILCANSDSDVFSIDIRDNTATKILSSNAVGGCYTQFYSIDVNPLNSYEFCVAGNMSCINVYDSRMPSDYLSQMYPERMGLNAFHFVDHVLYSHDGTEILASYDEGLYLFDLTGTRRRKNCTHKYKGSIDHFNTIRDINFFGSNSECITALADNGNIFIWEKKSEAIVRFIQGEENFDSLESHPHFPILATGGKKIYIWAPSSERINSEENELQNERIQK